LTNRAIRSLLSRQPRRTAPAPDGSPGDTRAHVDHRYDSPYGLGGEAHLEALILVVGL